MKNSMIQVIAQLMYYYSPRWFHWNTPFLEKMGYAWEIYTNDPWEKPHPKYKVRIWPESK